jgi:threonine dehydrogenase-like Zn-dependent dehydrogenase
VHVALALGARVVAMGRNSDALARLAALSPTRVETVRITNDATQDTAAIRAAAGGPIDVFFDISPTVAAESTHIRSGIDSVRPGGPISLMGGVRTDVPINYTSLMRRGLSVKGSCRVARSPWSYADSPRAGRNMDVHACPDLYVTEDGRKRRATHR